MTPATPLTLDRYRRTPGPAAPTPADLPAGLLDRLAALVDAPAALPAAVGPYPVTGLLGHGGMGVVYAATDPTLGRAVAVKVMTAGRFAGPAARASFAREGRAVAALRHDHVVPVYAAESPPDGPPYLVMPIVAGPTLAEAVRAGGGLAPRRAAHVARQVADALSAAHAAGLVHRDVKPANVLLDIADGRAKLTDFGLARGTDFGLARGAEPGAAATAERAGLCGTPEYMAPEQADRPDRADPRSDVYSLGCTLYECLTGVPPFRGPVADVLARHAAEEPVPPRRLAAGVPRDLQTICLKCLEKAPGRRYHSAAAARDDLDRFLAGRPTAARPLGPVARGWRVARRHPLPALLVVVSLVGAGASAAGWRRAGANAVEAEANAVEARTQQAAAEAARADAVAQAARAADRANLARDAVYELIAKAQELPDAAPGVLAVKRRLTEAGLGGLRRLAADTPGADLDAAEAHLTLGDAYEQLGRTDDSVAAWDAGRVAAEGAGDAAGTRARRLAARAHSALGFTRGRLGQAAVARAHHAAAVAAREALAGESPADPNALTGLSAALNAQADMARDAGDPACLAGYDRALELNRRAVALDPANESIQRAVAFTHTRLAYAHLSLNQDHASAAPRFQAAFETAAAGLARLPGDPNWQQYHLAALMGRAAVRQRAGEFDAAEADCREGIRLSEAAAAAAPENALLARRVAVAFCHLSWVEVGRGRFAEADALQGRAVALFREVAGRTKTSAVVRADLPPSLRLRADLSVRQGKYDEAADRVAEYATAALDGVADPAAAAVVRDIQAALRLVPQAVADPAVVAAQPKPVADKLAVFRVDALARAGDLTTARREAAALALARPADPAVLQTEAGVLGLAAAAATDPTERDRLLAAAVEALVAAVRADRTLAANLSLNPCLNNVRSHPTFLPRLKAVTTER